VNDLVGISSSQLKEWASQPSELEGLSIIYKMELCFGFRYLPGATFVKLVSDP
jgi:hypothetical protein